MHPKILWQPTCTLSESHSTQAVLDMDLRTEWERVESASDLGPICFLTDEVFPILVNAQVVSRDSRGFSALHGHVTLSSGQSVFIVGDPQPKKATVVWSAVLNEWVVSTFIFDEPHDPV